MNSGYNNLYIQSSPIIVNRGNFVMLTQTSAYVALNTAGNATYSDMAWQSSVWNKLFATSNWRFYLTPITNFSSYTNNFNLVHTYTNVGLYSISLTFLSYNQTFTQTVNITDCK